MITINLLPYELRPIKRTPLPYIGGAIVFAVVLAMVFLTFIAAQSNVNAANRLLLQHQDEFRDLESVVADYNALNARKQQLDKKAKTIEEIVADRLIWSRQLYNFSRLLPDNVWYSAIQVKTERYDEMITTYDAQGVPQTQRVPRTRRVVYLDGYVRPGEDGQTDVAPLMEKLENDDEFREMFTLGPVSSEVKDLEGMRVKEFTIPITITPGGADDD